jgi:hypothetical protein
MGDEVEVIKQDATPWWARSIYSIGPLAVIALVLVGVLIGFVPSPLASLTRDLNEIKVLHDRQTRVLMMICRNTAKNVSEMSRCDDN